MLVHGITHRNSPNANPNFIPIGDPSLISTRDGFHLQNGRLLGDYIPFYFGPRMPMLYVIQNGFNRVTQIPAEEIVYCITSIEQIIKNNLEFIFTDGHAINALSSEYTRHDISNLNKLLDWNAINSKYWKSETDLDLERRKQAEFLVLGDIPPQAILKFVVFNETAYNCIINFGISSDIIEINSDYYF